MKRPERQQLTYAEHQRLAGASYLRRTLQRCGGNRTKAARAAGLTRTGFLGMLKRYGFPGDPNVRRGNWGSLE